MNREGVKEALENGDFDGVSHTYRPYDGYGGQTYQRSMSVVGSIIEATLTTFGKFFDGKENTRYAEPKTDRLDGEAALDFIESHPYYFQEKRPDLF